MIKKIFRDIIGILGALVAWWSLAVIIGLLMYQFYPPTTTTFMAGISLEPQNIPGNAIGFVAALYAFRAVTRGWKGEDT